MRIRLDITRSLEQNAQDYFERAKKARRKAEGARKAVERLRAQERKKKPEKRVKREHWFHKYRWFYTSTGKLAIGGRDATTNEEIIKKRMGKYDLVFHAEIPGSPFFLLKLTPQNQPTETEIQEVANATLSYSKAWRYGIGSGEVYHVNPDQVSKSPRPGEYLAKGSFMIYGKKNLHHAQPELYLELTEIDAEAYVMITPYQSAQSLYRITPGSEKESDAARRIREALRTRTESPIHPDEIIRALPAGGVHVEDVR